MKMIRWLLPFCSLTCAMPHQAPWACSDVAVSGHDRVYAADQTSNTVSVIAPIQARQPRSNSASARSDNAYLIVNRAANFGTPDSINLSIDGVQVAVLGLNQSYEAVLRPGKHLLSMTTNPRTEGLTRLTQRILDAEPGKTYAFTALWDDSYHASLEDHAPIWQKIL